MKQSIKGQVVEQIVRPTNLVDPIIEVRPARTQIDDLLSEIQLRIEQGERVLVTTLTKRLAEDLTDYLSGYHIKVRYLHSEIDTVERVEIIRDLRLGKFDVLVGINLLREGLDIPEVSLVAILDADKEGFLRSARSLIQTIGRAARHINGTAILYADRMTDSMKKAIDETDRRRAKQVAHNEAHGVSPKGVQKIIKDLIDGVYESQDEERQKRVGKHNKGKSRIAELAIAEPEVSTYHWNDEQIAQQIKKLEKQMIQAARDLEFEKAAKLRDEIRKFKDRLMGIVPE